MHKYSETKSSFVDDIKSQLDILAGQGAIGERDVMGLRRAVAAGAPMEREHIEAMFRLGTRVRPGCDAWTDFLVDTVTDFVVWDQRPTGLLDESNAQWLVALVDSARCATALAVLINVLDVATRVPRWFVAAVRARAVEGWPGTEMLTRADMATGLRRAA